MGGRGGTYGSHFAGGSGGFASKNIRYMTPKELLLENKRLEAAKDIATRNANATGFHQERIDYEGSPDKRSPNYNDHYGKPYTWNKSNQSRLDATKRAIKNMQNQLTKAIREKREYESTKQASRRLRSDIWRQTPEAKTRKTMPPGWGLTPDGRIDPKVIRSKIELRAYNKWARQYNKTHPGAHKPIYNTKQEFLDTFNANVGRAANSSRTRPVTDAVLRGQMNRATEQGFSVGQLTGYDPPSGV